MKSIRRLALLLLTPALLHAQGSLTPPAGLPVASMKTLDQVEARTVVNKLTGDATAVYVISTPGNYYLTGPITGAAGKAGIRIDAADVTLDLHGFQLTGAAGATNGIIFYSGARGTIDGNHVSSSGTGINTPGTTSLVVRNIATANTTNFNLNAGQVVASSSAPGTNPNANITE